MSNTDTLSREDYTEVLDSLYQRTAPLAIAALTAIGEVCKAAGMKVTEPVDLSVDTYEWNLSVYRSATDEGVDISLEIAESVEYDGEVEFGVNFGVTAVEYGGRVLAGFTPFNFTSDCWVDARDTDAVDARWALIDAADFTALPALLNPQGVAA